MATAKKKFWTVLCVGFLFACGGDEPAPQASPPGDVPGSTAQETTDSIVASESQTELMREVFSYRGAGRDPFLSLLQSGDVRPLIEDLRVTSVAYDPRYPTNSVAVLRDTIANETYAVRVGDELGRMTIAEIHPGEVVVTIMEFGSERQEILRQRQERTP